MIYRAIHFRKQFRTVKTELGRQILSFVVFNHSNNDQNIVVLVQKLSLIAIYTASKIMNLT